MRCFKILHHNMALPCYMTEIRCKRETFSCDARAVSLWESASPRDELEWYLDQTVCRRTKLQLSRVLTCDEQHYLEFRERKLRTVRGKRPSLVLSLSCVWTRPFLCLCPPMVCVGSRLWPRVRERNCGCEGRNVRT